MDILVLLERLEETLRSGTPLPFTSRLLVDENEALDILDQIRVAIPEELKQARRLLAERDSIVAEATEQAERLLREADHRLNERLDEHALVRDAERRAEEIRQDALQAARRMRSEADAYVYNALNKMHAQLQTLIEQVERGMRALESELRSPEEDDDVRAR